MLGSTRIQTLLISQNEFKFNCFALLVYYDSCLVPALLIYYADLSFRKFPKALCLGDSRQGAPLCRGILFESLKKGKSPTLLVSQDTRGVEDTNNTPIVLAFVTFLFLYQIVPWCHRHHHAGGSDRGH
jgi:hypothetical protein